jgi:hypothetical protein
MEPEPVMANSIGAEPTPEPDRIGIQSTLRDYEIGIRFLSIGMVIRVGCREIPFTSVEEGMAALNAYVADPHTEIREWMKKFD